MTIPDQQVAALIGRRLILSTQQQIVEVLGPFGQLNPKAGPGPVGHAPVPAATGVAFAADVSSRAVACVNVARGAEALEHLRVHAVVIALSIDTGWAAVGLYRKTEPDEVLEHRALELAAAAHAVVVLDAEQDRAAERTRQAPDVDGVHEMPEVQVPCRRWSIPGDGWRAAELGSAEQIGSNHHDAGIMVVEPTPQGLYCEAGGFHIDPWQPVARAVITHAHADHLRDGSGSYLCAEPSLPLLKQRLPDGATITSLSYDDEITIGDVRLSLHPAGHVLGSSQVRIEHGGEVWVLSGDYKRAADPTCTPFEPIRCHTFVTEATFGLPVFRWDESATVVAEIIEWWEEMRSGGRPAVLFAYALGKAQRILAELASRTDRTIYVHGALEELLEIYRAAGVRLPPTRRAVEQARGSTFAGELIVAPVSARGTLWMRRFAGHSAAFASGWMRVRGARRRRAFDRGFALSDHADWDALVRTVTDTGAERVFVTHGYTEPLARYLSGLGIRALPWHTGYQGESE